MKTRLVTAVGLLSVLAAGGLWAFNAAQLHVFRAGIAGSLKYDLLFNSAVWLIPVAVFLGIGLGTLNSEKESTKFVNGKIERHSEEMFFQHWSHALGCVALIITGVALGTLFIPRSLQGAEKVGFALNLHFIGVCFFLFGIAYYVTKEALLGEIKHMMPHQGDLAGFIGHYKAMLQRKPLPPEEKFLCAERVVFPLWIIGVSGIVLSGAFKVAAHVWNLPGGLMGVMSFLHGVFTIYMTLMLVGHVFAGALLPASWPLIRSMLTGYVTIDYAKHHHELWWKELEREMAEQGLGNVTNVGKSPKGLQQQNTLKG